MEEKQTMTQAQLEAALSRRRGSITLFKILTYGSGLAAVLLLAAGLVPVALICLVLAFVFGYRLSKNTAALKTLLSGNIVSGVLREVFEDVEYEPFGRIPDGTVRGAGMVFPFAYDSIRGSDHIKAVYRGLRLELGDVELYAADSYYDEELQQWKQSEKRVFKGQWLVCDFDRPLPGEVRLSENARVLRRQHKGDCVETESAAFNAHFLVTAEDARGGARSPHAAQDGGYPRGGRPQRRRGLHGVPGAAGSCTSRFRPGGTSSSSARARRTSGSCGRNTSASCAGSRTSWTRSAGRRRTYDARDGNTFAAACAGQHRRLPRLPAEKEKLAQSLRGGAVRAGAGADRLHRPDRAPCGRGAESAAGVKNKKRQQALRLLPFAARKSHLANGGSGCYNRENS